MHADSVINGGYQVRSVVAPLAVIAALLCLPSSAVGAPPFRRAAQTSFTTSTSPKSETVTGVQAGDILVAYSLTEDQSVAASVAGGGLTWTQRQQVNVSAYGRA